MAEDWLGVQAEVAEAIGSIGLEADGHPCCLRKKQAPVLDPDDPDGDFADPQPLGYDYETIFVLEGTEKNFDRNSGVLMKDNRLMVGATGPVPEKQNQVAIGIRAGEQTDDTKWIEIEEVQGYSPGGVVLYYYLNITR